MKMLLFLAAAFFVPAIPDAARVRGTTSRSGCAVRRWVVVGGGLLAVLGGCSDDKGRRRNSELVVDQRAAPTTEPAATAPAAPESTSSADPTGPLVGVGRRYRVAVGTAYFFDGPRQSTPNGKYLRRGDVFYGEGEWNGFVKTGFVGPAGERSTGWLKRQELSTAAERPTAAPAPAVAPLATASGVRSAVVQTARAYFHNSPDLATPRKAHCVRGDKVRLGEERGAAVYATFTNWENVTTTGWMRKDALTLVR